ncbi:MAG: hypothetical protein CMI90_00100 [Pelagibacteraceae bacterium]|nr:hypothetical protein [Pelagibacteraceae bacterium]
MNKKILGIGTVTPIWDEIFKEINIDKKNIYIFNEDFDEKNNNLSEKLYSYPNIIINNKKIFFNKLKFISTYELLQNNYLKYNNNLSRFFPNFMYFSLDQRLQYIDRLVRKLIKIILSNPFKLVICGSPPHRVYDVIIRDICESNSIKFIYPDFQYFEEFGCLIENNDDFVKKINTKKNVITKINKNIFRLEEIKIINQIKSLTNKKRVPLTNKTILSSNLKQNIFFKIIRLLQLNKSINPIMLKFGFPKRSSYLRILFASKMNQYGLRQSQKYYDKFSINFSKLKNKKYIYFLPSYQPERSTNPDGNIYYEHYYALSILSRHLPKNYIILYKEHPKSFDKYFKNIIYRDKNYFIKIRENLKNIYFIKDYENSIKIMQKSVFIAGVNGSSGHESYYVKKPYLLFGDAQYQNYPNVIKYINKNSIIEAMNFKFTNKTKLKFNKIKLGIQRMYIIRDYWRYNSFFRFGHNKEKFDYENIKKNFQTDITNYIKSDK